jgi:hypothetical protein
MREMPDAPFYDETIALAMAAGKAVQMAFRS